MLLSGTGIKEDICRESKSTESSSAHEVLADRIEDTCESRLVALPKDTAGKQTAQNRAFSSSTSIYSDVCSRPRPLIKNLSKSISLGSPRLGPFPGWHVPSLQFRPSSFSTFSQVHSDRPRILGGKLSSESSTILSPTPERPVSSQSTRDRFSKILGIEDDSFSASASSVNISWKKDQAHLAANSGSAAGNDQSFRGTFPPIRERDSSGEASMSEQRSDDEHEKRSSARTDRFKSTVESLLDKHIESLGLKPEVNDAAFVSDQQGLGEHDLEVRDLEGMHSTESLLHTKWRGNVRSAKIVPSDEDSSRSSKLSTPGHYDIADIVPKRVSSIGSTLKFQEYLKTARPSSSWMTIDSSDNLTSDLASALGLTSTPEWQPRRRPYDDRNGLTGGGAQQPDFQNHVSVPTWTTVGERHHNSSVEHEKHWILELNEGAASQIERRTQGSDLEKNFRQHMAAELDRVFASDQKYMQRQAVSMESNRVSLPAPLSTPRKSMGDHPSSMQRSIALTPLPSLPTLIPLDGSFRSHGDASTVMSSIRRDSDKLDSSTLNFQSTRQRRDSQQIPPGTLSAPSFIPVSCGSNEEVSGVRTESPSKKSLLGENWNHAKDHAGNAIKQSWQNMKTYISSPPKACSARTSQQKSSGIVQLCNVSGPPRNQNWSHTVGMSEFTYRKNKVFESIKAWWKKHTSPLACAFGRRKNRKSLEEVELYAGV